MTAADQSFEDKLALLEQIVKEMEGDELSLKESLERFERGIKLYRDCKQVIGEVETKISILTESLKEEEFQIE